MIKKIIFLINLICLFILLYIKIENKNFKNNKLLSLVILIVLVLINSIYFIIKYLNMKFDSVNYDIHDIKNIECYDEREPIYKTSNDELIELIENYNKNNNSGEQK